MNRAAGYVVATLAGILLLATLGVPDALASGPADKSTRSQTTQATDEASATSTPLKLTPDDARADALFGGAVAVDRDTAVIGAYRDGEAGYAAGAAYIFQQSDGVWTQQAKLIADDAATKDLFGVSVAIDGDTVVVGSFFDDDKGSHSGSVYVFRGSGDAWSQQGKLVASDGVEGDLFGIAISISGDVVAVGSPWADAPGTDSGAIYVFRWDGSEWLQEAKLTPGDGAAQDLFGYSVSISGDTIVAGAILADAQGRDSGAAYVFQWDGTTWSQKAKLTADGGNGGDLFGVSVSIKGDAAIIGASHEGKGSGAAYIFRRIDSTWAQEAKLALEDTGENLFGSSVVLGADVVVVGAPAYGSSGSAHIFRRQGSTWSRTARLTPTDATSSLLFSERAVSVSGNTILIGAPLDDGAGDNSGSVYVFAADATSDTTTASDTTTVAPGKSGAVRKDGATPAETRRKHGMASWKSNRENIS